MGNSNSNGNNSNGNNSNGNSLADFQSALWSIMSYLGPAIFAVIAGYISVQSTLSKVEAEQAAHQREANLWIATIKSEQAAQSEIKNRLESHIASDDAATKAITIQVDRNRLRLEAHIDDHPHHALKTLINQNALGISQNTIDIQSVQEEVERVAHGR